MGQSMLLNLNTARSGSEPGRDAANNKAAVGTASSTKDRAQRQVFNITATCKPPDQGAEQAAVAEVEHDVLPVATHKRLNSGQEQGSLWTADAKRVAGVEPEPALQLSTP